VTGQEAGGESSEGCGAFQAVGSTGGGRPAGLCPRAVIREKGGRGNGMHPRSPVYAHRQGRGGTGQREVLLRRLVLLVLLAELTVHVVVLGLILEVLQMLPLLVMMVLLRGRQRDSVLLAHDAAAGSLWVVDEGSHHGGGTE